MVQSAVILAAGRGVRMGERGREIPKGFIKVGDKPIICESLERLVRSGVRRVRFVTGHLAPAYETLAAQFSGRLALEFAFNPNFATMGALESLRIGIAGVEEPFLLLESDIVYETRALTSAIAHRAGTVVLVSGETGSGDEVYTWATAAKGGGEPQLLALSKKKDANPERSLGEMVGIFKIGPDFCALLRKHAVTMLQANHKAEYEPSLVAASREMPATCLKIDDLVWAEIDDEIMLERVRTRVHPRIDPA